MDVGTVLAAVGSSTLIATAASAVVSWKVASHQNQVEREKLAHERERHDHGRLSRKRDDARVLLERVTDELDALFAAMQLVHDRWDDWQERSEVDDPETTAEVRQVFDAVTGSNARMPRLLSDLIAGSWEVLPDAAWREMADTLVAAQQMCGRVVLDAMGGSDPTDSWREWLLTYGRANVTARRFIAEID